MSLSRFDKQDVFYSTAFDSSGNAVTDSSGNPAGYVTFPLISGEDESNNVIVVEQGQFSYVHITTATTTDVKATAGFLHAIVINGGTAGAVTVYDDTTGGTTTPIAVIAAAAAATPAGTKEYNCVMSNGIQIVTAAATDVTVIYR